MLPEKAGQNRASLIALRQTEYWWVLMANNKKYAKVIRARDTLWVQWRVRIETATFLCHMVFILNIQLPDNEDTARSYQGCK